MDKEGPKVIYCKKHLKYQINFLNVSEDNFNEPKCEECLMEGDCQLKDYISIQTINVCSDDYIFSNWPPVNSTKLLKDIQSLMKQESLMIEELELQFSQIIQEVTKKFEEVKKKLIQYLINSNQQKNEILKCYNQISGKEKLKKLINLNQQTVENQLNDLRQFVSLCQKQKDQNTNILQQQFQRGLYDGQIYFRYKLNKQKNYIVRFKFNDEIGNFLIIGLTDENNLLSILSNTRLGKIFGQNNHSYGGKVLQGNNFYQTKKDQIVEMRIDLQNESLQFLDNPDYQNINALNDNYKLNQNANYFLALYYGCNSQFNNGVDLIYFEEIEK
ncbi:hypothetical protein ABPG72_007796 [Tetrahymena utriculariae]